MERIAVYAASLDPITNGHINVIERMAPLYDELVVLVAADPQKTYTFTPEERMSMARVAISHLSNVTVDICIGQYVVKYAASISAQVIIRGLRNFKDLESEQALAEENRKICPGIETVWVPCLPDLMHVSSSMVKGHVGIAPGWEEQVTRSVPAAVVPKLREKFILKKAQKHWATLQSQLGYPPESETVFKNLLLRYNETRRAYHTIEHIVAMLDEFEQLIDGDNRHISDILALRLAIWFHDVTYVPKAIDNGKRSADLADTVLKQMGVPTTLRRQVKLLIMATRHITRPRSHDAKILADLDLAILGKPQKEFDAYETGIRKECIFVPKPVFCKGRSDVLERFLDRPHIYSTEVFRKKYEDTARENLRRSIRELQK